MFKDVLVIGHGYFGQRLQSAWECQLAHNRIESYVHAQKIIQTHKPRIVVNCIGYNGDKNVDDCEKNADKTFMANTFIPIMLADLSLRHGFKLVQFSSGCIYHYDHQKDAPRTENDPPDYFDLTYSRSKIEMEKALLGLMPQLDVLLVRVRMPLDDRPHPHNILTKLLQFKKVISVPNSVTYVPDMITMLTHLLKINARGLYNLMNAGAMYFPQLLEVCRARGIAGDYEVVDFQNLGIKRTNIIHSIEKLRSTGVHVRDIKEVYSSCVQNYQESLSRVAPVL